MNVVEKDALLVYLEARILDLCDNTISDADVMSEVATIYDDAYELLADIECSMDAIVEIANVEDKKSTKT